MADGNMALQRARGQGFRATKRFSETPLERNLVVRCSDKLYEAAQYSASAHHVTLSDYVRDLIIRDVEGDRTPTDAS